MIATSPPVGSTSGSPTDVPTPAAVTGGPAWAVARLFPPQGDWDDADYFPLDDTFPRFELVDGSLVELPVPTEIHQDILEWLLARLKAHLGRNHVRSAGYKLRIRERTPRVRNDYRYPDVIASVDRAGFGPDYATAATLVVEILIPGEANRQRDLVDKRVDYAEAAVPEYWVVDPEARTLLQRRLVEGHYEEMGTFGASAVVTSHAVPGLTVDLAEMVGGGPSDDVPAVTE